MSPTFGRAPTRRELIEDAAYVEWESRGHAPVEREEATLAAIWRTLGLIASRLGIDMNEEARLAGEPESIRPKAPPELSEEERQRRDDEETRRSFAGLLARAKRAAAAERKRNDNAT